MGDRVSIAIRDLAVADAAGAAKLSSELGYPVPEGIIQQRLTEIAAAEDHCVLGAYVEGRLAGWIDLGIVQHLQSGKYGEIGGLIVAVGDRGRGIGKALVAAAEQWVAGRGVEKLLVRSQIVREDAHAFYAGLDFTRVKTSAVFTKHLGGNFE